MPASTARDLVRETMAQTALGFDAQRSAHRMVRSVARGAVPHHVARLTPRYSTGSCAFWDLPEGTLGRVRRVLRRNGFPSCRASVANPAFFVAHDMTHVIAGYGTTGPEEDARCPR
ncbi:MAG: hypothetical protein U0W40_13600 [Acidimicrobiia bacterium]